MILIAGIGNIFLGDDAFGCELAQRLARRSWPDGVVVRDFGIACRELNYALDEPWDAVIVLDACRRGQPPGTAYHIRLDDAAPAAPADPHSFSIADVRRVPNMHIVGCEPMSFDPRDLTSPVAAALPAAEAMVAAMVAAMIAETIAAWAESQSDASPHPGIVAPVEA